MMTRIKEKLDPTYTADDTANRHSLLRYRVDILVKLKLDDPATTLIGI